MTSRSSRDERMPDVWPDTPKARQRWASTQNSNRYLQAARAQTLGCFSAATVAMLSWRLCTGVHHKVIHTRQQWTMLYRAARAAVMTEANLWSAVFLATPAKAETDSLELKANDEQLMYVVGRNAT